MSGDIRRWLSLSDEEQLLENGFYKREYESAAEWLGQTVPPWESLTHEQRDAVRQESIRYQREMHEFGKRLTQ